MKVLFVAWQDQIKGEWYPVAKLIAEENKFSFCYTKGALSREGFKGFGRMNDLNKTYVSGELFPFFKNRLLSKGRPEYEDMLRWLNLKHSNNIQLEMLALGGGRRGTDNIEIFQCPEKDSHGRLTINFFCHGIRHISMEAQSLINKLRPSQRLFLVLDVQNNFDPNAILLRTDDPINFTGYCPRYLARDFKEILDHVDRTQISVVVEKVNLEAPWQFRLLCSLNAPCPDGYRPCSDDMYSPLDMKSNGTCILTSL